ncbi:hypothetical protein BB560_002661 [Smittium megazygosporum]|uniref:Uncharacterized protein n=1 Tax=Smittium megazygosporum TaxID=133381 RepID=A0A2T9ZE65_9FUNG|nr:hypothetical protein BB560_002661 [Smittium megazygosporum]
MPTLQFPRFWNLKSIGFEIQTIFKNANQTSYKEQPFKAQIRFQINRVGIMHYSSNNLDENDVNEEKKIGVEIEPPEPDSLAKFKQIYTNYRKLIKFKKGTPAEDMLRDANELQKLMKEWDGLKAEIRQNILQTKKNAKVILDEIKLGGKLKKNELLLKKRLMRSVRLIQNQKATKLKAAMLKKKEKERIKKQIEQERQRKKKERIAIQRNKEKNAREKNKLKDRLKKEKERKLKHAELQKKEKLKIKEKEKRIKQREMAKKIRLERLKREERLRQKGIEKKLNSKYRLINPPPITKIVPFYLAQRLKNLMSIFLNQHTSSGKLSVLKKKQNIRKEQMKLTLSD